MELIEEFSKSRTKFDQIFSISRQSFKKTTPKMNFGKLPSVFGDAFGKTMRSISRKNEEIPEIIPVKKKLNEKLLSPVNINPVLNELNKDHFHEKRKNMFSKKKASRKARQKNNPLAPIRNYKEYANELELEYQNSKIELPYLLNIKLSLNEMITLKVLKSNRATGTVKVMFHLPTLQLYAIKEEALGNKEVRKKLKDWISFWQTNFSNSSRHVKIYATFWNSPEGCVSIVEELVSGISLQKMLENVGSLNESSLKFLAKEILLALLPLHSAVNYYSALTPSQILINAEGNIKVFFPII